MSNEFTVDLSHSPIVNNNTLCSGAVTPYPRIVDPYPVVINGDVPFNATQLTQIEEVVRRVVGEELAKSRQEMVEQAVIELAKQVRAQGVVRRG